MKENKKEQISRIQLEVSTAKFQLIEALDKLMEIGAKKEADSLAIIIDELEMWQDK